MSVRTRVLARTSAVAAIATLGLAGCGGGGGGGGSTSSTTPTVAKDPKIAAEVPVAIRKKQTLTVAADATYAPNEFIEPGSQTVVGMDADLAKALASVMGLKARVVNANFDSIIPGLAAHKYDVGMSSFTDTKEREKTVDFVTYFSAGTSFFTKAKGGAAVNGLADLCGKSVSVEKGTTQADDAAAQAKKCRAAAKPGVKVLVFPDQNGANLALSSGRAQVGMADSPVADYQVKKSGGQFKLTGPTYGSAPYGIALPKNSGLDRPFLDALKVLMSNGTYRAILKKWGIESGAITNPTVNGATS